MKTSRDSKITKPFTDWVDNAAFYMLIASVFLGANDIHEGGRVVFSIACGMYLASVLTTCLEWLANRIPFTRWELRRFNESVRKENEEAAQRFITLTDRNHTH